MTKSKQQVSVLFMLFSILFCVCLIVANILETKQISVLGISLTGGLIVFPISYIINDCVCEVWGFQKARLLIWTGFAMNFFFVSMGALCDWIPGAPYWTNEAGFHAIFGLAPRVAAASNFSLRAILSTIVGESFDSVIFFPLALGGVVPTEELPKLMLWQVLLKTVYEVIALPITIRIVKALKEHEGEDTYDNDVNYSIWKIFALS